MKVRITAIRQTVYPDLMAKYENPIEHTCDVTEGQQWISVDGKQPEGMCPAAWYSMREFVESLPKADKPSPIEKNLLNKSESPYEKLLALSFTSLPLILMILPFFPPSRYCCVVA